MGGLTFVPPNKVPGYFNFLSEELKQDPLDLPDYSQRTYCIHKNYGTSLIQLNMDSQEPMTTFNR
jgi:hypothetical protein